MLPADRRKHAITFLTFWGKEMLSTQDNVFEQIQKCDRRFVVDNNIDWFELSAAPGNANAAFILGTTADKESSPLRLLLERGDGTPKVRDNVFLFGMKSPTAQDVLCGHRTPLLVISRLDAHATRIRDMNALRQFDQPGGGKAKWDTSESIAHEKGKVLALLGVNCIEEVVRLPNRESKDEELRRSVERERSKCFKRFWESNDVSRFAYARLLLGADRLSRQARREFVERAYPNVFGDRDLIQNALFFNAGVLSKDRGVKKMARLCDLLCSEMPR